MSHFSPEVVSRLNEIEQEAGADIEKIDWRPFTRYWGDLRKIIDECSKLGYKTTRTHFNEHAIKSNIPIEELINIVKINVNYKNVKKIE